MKYLVKLSKVSSTLVLAGLVSACGIFDSGDSRPRDAYDDEGRERISILATTQYLDADSAISGLPVVVPAPYTNGNWSQPGGNTNHSVQHLNLPENISKAWSVSIGAGDKDFQKTISGPVAADGRVFAVDVNGDTTAVSLDTGRRLWTYEASDGSEKSDVGYGGGAAYADGNVYVTSGFGFITSLDAASGSVNWEYKVGVPMRGAPTVADNRVFAITHDNQMITLDAESGEIVWEQVGIAETAGMLGAASAAYDNGTVVHALSSGEVIAMRGNNGRILWQDALTSSQRLTPLATLADVDAYPVIDNNRVYAVSHGGRMVAIDMRSGERSWEADIAGVNTPWIAGNFAFMTTIDGQIVCVSLGDGRVRWVTQLQRFTDQEKRRGLVKWNGPVLAGDRLLITSSHGFAMSVSPYTGEVLSGVKLDSGTITPPIVVDQTFIVQTDKGELVAYR